MIVTDEVTDDSNKELLTYVLRYVDESLLIMKDLVAFTKCYIGITGWCLASKITSTVEGYNLDLQNLCGQAYDGAGNMAGTTNCLAAVITNQYQQALYIHCASHCLNLAVRKSLQVSSIKNMMGCIGRVYQFLRHTQNIRGHLKMQLLVVNQPQKYTSWKTCVVPGGFNALMPYIFSSLSTSPLWIAWKIFAVTALSYGVLTHLQMPEGCIMQSQQLTSCVPWWSQMPALGTLKPWPEVSRLRAEIW